MTLPYNYTLVCLPTRSRAMWQLQVGQPMVRVSFGKLQLGVVVDIAGDKLLVAVVVPSRVMPDTSIDKNQVKCVHVRPPCCMHKRVLPRSNSLLHNGVRLAREVKLQRITESGCAAGPFWPM